MPRLPGPLVDTLLKLIHTYHKHTFTHSHTHMYTKFLGINPEQNNTVETHVWRAVLKVCCGCIGVYPSKSRYHLQRDRISRTNLLWKSKRSFEKVYYKVWLTLLQSAAALFITKCDRGVLQSATAILLKSVIEVITKCDRYYKVWLRLLQSRADVISSYRSVRQSVVVYPRLKPYWFEMRIFSVESGMGQTS